MRLVVILFVSILALTWTPGLVSAQGLFGCSDVGSSGGFPILGKLFGKKKNAVSCYDDPPRGGGLALYVGYLDNDDGVAFDVIARENSINVEETAVRYPVSGVLLAASGTIPVGKRLDILVNGSWLIPSQGGEATEVRRNANSELTWLIKNQWWNAGAAVTFNIGGPFSVIGGFLVDSFSTNFSNPTNLIGGGGTSLDDEGDLTVGTVIPYIGGLLTQGGPSGGLTIGMIGTPIVFGDARWTQSANQGAAVSDLAEISGPVDTGYFFEIFAETAVNIRAMSFGLFGGWNITHSRMDMNFDYSQGFVAPAFQSRDYTGSFYRRAWVVGGKFALDFFSPL